MTPLLLSGLALALALAAPGALVRARWTGRSPQLAVLAWETVAVTLVACVVTAALTMIMPWHHGHDAMCTVWRVCLDALVGAHGTLAQVLAWTGLVVLAGALVRITIAGASLRGAAVRRHRHAELVRLVGRRQPELCATVVESPDSAVYLIPGRAEEIVVTTGALSRLDQDALAAVLAHERAHARGRHHLLLAVTALLHQAFPAIKAFEHAERQVRRLVEICADDDACRRHSPLALARALVTLSSPAAAPGTLAAGGEALERVHRLMDPPQPLPRRGQTAAAAVLVALPLVPLAIVLAAPVVPALAAGPPLW